MPIKSEIGEQAIVDKVAAIVQSSNQRQREYLSDLLGRWDIHKKGLINRYGFHQSLVPLRLRIKPELIDAVFFKYQIENKRHNLKEPFMNTLVFLDQLYGKKHVVKNSEADKVQKMALLSIKHPAVVKGLKDFRLAIGRRGGLNGIRTLDHALRIYDHNNTNILTINKLKAAIKQFGLDLPEIVVDSVLEAVSRHQKQNGEIKATTEINYFNFLKIVRGDIPKIRENIVQAYNTLDLDKNGYISFQYLIDEYNAYAHPYVKSGRMTMYQAQKDFSVQFNGHVEQDGKITYNDFLEYYKDLSATVDQDDFFIYMVRKSWNLDGDDDLVIQDSRNRRVVLKDEGSGEVHRNMGFGGDYAITAHAHNYEMHQPHHYRYRDDFEEKVGPYSPVKVNHNIDNNLEREAYNLASREMLHRGNNSRGNSSRRNSRPNSSNRRSSSRPGSSGSRPGSSGIRPGSSNMRPGSSGSRPGSSGTRLIKYETRFIKYETRIIKYETRIIKYETRIIKYETGSSNMRPDSSNSRPRSSNSRPRSSNSRPRSSNSRPRSSNNRPRNNIFTSSVIDAFKEFLISIGGEYAIQRVITIFAQFIDSNISIKELQLGLNEYGLAFTSHDCATILTAMDTQNRGIITFEQFIMLLRDNISPKRQELILDIWNNILDPNNTLSINTNDLINKYHAIKHPQVQLGNATKRTNFKCICTSI